MSIESQNLLNLHLQIKPLADKVKTFILKNGLQCLMYQDTSKPKVLVQLAYNVGSSIERSDEKGLAHLVEHMIFKGTKKMAEGDIDAIARKFGASFNAYTSHDVTSYYFETNKSSWKIFLDILADCMNNSRFEEQHLASELKAVVQELNMYKDNLDSKVAEKALELSFPPNHPYHFPVIGFKEELARLHAPALYDFYRRYYHPSKAALFVVGDIDFNEVELEVEKLFGSFENPLVELFPQYPILLDNLESNNLKILEQIEKEKICFYWRVPGLDSVSSALVDVFSELFAGGASSKIYRSFVDEKQVAHDVSFQADLMHRAGIMLLFVLPATDDFVELKKMLLDEIKLIMKNGFSEDEINRVKSGLALSFIRKTESWSGLVSDWINEIFLHSNPRRVFDYLSELNDVTNESLLSFFNKYFSENFVNSISLLSLPENLKSIWSENQKIIKSQEELILSSHVRTVELEIPKRVHELENPSFFKFDFPTPEVIKTDRSRIELICYEKPSYPITFFKLNFKNSFILSKDKEGLIVSLMMEMLLEKSKNFSKYENLEYLENLGAHFSFDSDGLSLSTLAGSFDLALERMLDIFCNPDFDKTLLEKQKEILLADISERSDDPQKIGIQEFYKKCYFGTGLSWDYAQAADLVKSISTDDLILCHQKYCNPESFFVAISGLFDKNKIGSILDDSFKNIEKKSFVFENNFGKVVPTNSHILMLRDQTTLILARPSSVSLKDDDYLPLSILNIIMFYSLGSRLYKIREEQGLFYSIFGGFAIDANTSNSLDYICTLLNSEDVPHAKSEILKELLNVKTNGITEAELSDAKQIYLNSLINMFADTPSATQVMVALKLFGREFDYYKKIFARLELLNVDELNLVANKYINIDQFTTVTVGK